MVIDIDYHSPVMTGRASRVPEKKHFPIAQMKPIVINNAFGSGQDEHILTIDEGESLSDLVNSIKQ